MSRIIVKLVMTSWYNLLY